MEVGFREFYYLHYADEPATVAHSTRGFDCRKELRQLIVQPSPLPFHLEVEHGQLRDYLPNDLAVPLVSTNLREIATEFADDTIHFKEVSVAALDCTLSYHFLVFTRHHDVLDFDRTLFAGKDFVVKACLDARKTQDLHLFTIPDPVLPLPVSVIVSHEIKSRIERERLVGCEFSPVPIA